MQFLNRQFKQVGKPGVLFVSLLREVALRFLTHSHWQSFRVKIAMCVRVVIFFFLCVSRENFEAERAKTSRETLNYVSVVSLEYHGLNGGKAIESVPR